MLDYVAISGTMENRVIEYVDHLHEHFVDPVLLVGDRYAAPMRPGYSSEMIASSLDRFEFPMGEAWQGA